MPGWRKTLPVLFCPAQCVETLPACKVVCVLKGRDGLYFATDSLICSG